MDRHGLSIGIQRNESDFFVTLKAIGKLTHEDFQVITPMIDSALDGVSSAKIRILVDGSELEGWEPRGAWDDFKLGLKHGKEIEKVAIYGNSKWQKMAVKVGSWFIAGEKKNFQDMYEAVKWLKQ